jgi:hypothetical protein
LLLLLLLFRLRIVPFGKAQIDYIRYPLSMDISKIKKDDPSFLKTA